MFFVEEEKWIKKVITECLGDEASEDTYRRRLEGFSMLVAVMASGMEKKLAEAKLLWEKDPQSQELKQILDLLGRSLSYLRRFCKEKISPKYQKGGKDG